MRYILKNTCAALLFILSYDGNAQSIADSYYLQSMTIKQGDEVEYEAITAILSSATESFIVEDGGHAVLKSGGRIELNPGFQVLAGGRLSATIEVIPNDPQDNPSSVFPNPTDGTLNVVAAAPVSSTRLTDMDGLLVMEQTDINSKSFTMDIGKALPGYYILELVFDKSIEQVRIVKK